MKLNRRLHFLSFLGIAVAVFLAIGSSDTSSSTSGPGESHSSSTTDSSPSDSSSGVDEAYKERFAAVAKIFISVGARVDPMDPTTPYTMRAYVPSSLAMEMTPVQAREMAGMARSRLHDRAIVYLKSEGGQQLAKASPWGIE